MCGACSNGTPPACTPPLSSIVFSTNLKKGKEVNLAWPIGRFVGNLPPRSECLGLSPLATCALPKGVVLTYYTVSL